MNNIIKRKEFPNPFQYYLQNFYVRFTKVAIYFNETSIIYFVYTCHDFVLIGIITTENF